MPSYTKEQLMELLAVRTLQYGSSGSAYLNINQHQKMIQNGQVVVGRDPNQAVIVYKSDLKSHQEDFFNLFLSQSYDYSNNIHNINTNQMYEAFENYMVGLPQPENVSQFVNFQETGSYINPELAKNILDYNIRELLTVEKTRQERIDEFFTEFTSLVNPIPNFEEVDGNIQLTEDYDDIDLNPDNQEASIIRLTEDENDEQSADGQSLESLRDTLNQYLLDVDQSETTSFVDDRPEYDNINDGFLKFRSLNHAVIIKHEEGKQISFSETDPATGNPHYLQNGFTIAMWVRFLNKVTTGTLFNFGNPTRLADPHGFKLETFVLKNGQMDSQPGNLFLKDENERFIRLIVREASGTLRHSGVGSDFESRNTSIGDLEDPTNTFLFNYTNIPVNLNEWYYIVASYDPNKLEDLSHSNYMDNDDFAPDGTTLLKNSPEFWRNNINPSDGSVGTWTHSSNYGAKCKVEIISKTDLLRARGFKTEASN